MSGDDSSYEIDTSEYLEYIWEKLRLAKKGNSNKQPKVVQMDGQSSGGSDNDDDLSQYCLEPEWHALNNPSSQNPCQVARALIDTQAPNYGYYDLPPLHYQTRYPIPNPSQVTDSLCNVPVYNLLQACAGCQQANVTKSIPWYAYSSNCNRVFIAFPQPVPQSVQIPDWANQDTTQTPLNLGLFTQFFNQSHSAQQPFDGSSSSSSSVPAVTSTAADASSTSTPIPAATPAGDTPNYPGEHPANKQGHTIGIIVSLVVAGALFLGIASALTIFFRRKRRTRRQGQRLGSTADLSEVTTFDEMIEKPSSSRTRISALKPDDISIFVPTETMVSSRASTTSRATFDTNSSSSQSHEFRAYLRETAATAPSFTTFDTTSRSSIVSGSTATATSSEEEGGATSSSARSLSFDDSISPFADVHRAPSIRTLDSHLSIPSSLHIPPPTATTRPSGAPLGRRYDHVRDSLATTASDPRSVLSATRSEVSLGAPSSTGAVYGRDGGEDGEDGEDDEGSTRGSVRRGSRDL